MNDTREFIDNDENKIAGRCGTLWRKVYLRKNIYVRSPLDTRSPCLSLSLSLVEKHTSAENQEGGALRGNETNEKEISSPENEREKGSRIEIFKTHCSAGKGFVDLKITTGKDQSSD